MAFQKGRRTMWLRILVGGLVGGVIVFCTGAFNHMVLGLQGRTLHNLPGGASFVEHVKGRDLKPGLYMFPDMPTGAAQAEAAADATAASRQEARQRLYEDANERYKAGPAGMLLIVPTGQDMMTGETLVKELVTNTAAALIVAWIVSLMAAEVGFVRRWLAVLVMGTFAWFSLAASYGIWYRFPHDFIHDELLCSVIEWGVAGLAIAAIVRRRTIPVAIS